MRTIRIASVSNQRGWPLVRQTPHASARWGDAVFLTDEHVHEADHLVVVEGISEPLDLWCDPRNTVLFLCEPPSIRSYNPRFAAQFAQVVTVHEALEHPNRILSQPCLPWHAGMDTSPWHILPRLSQAGGEKPNVPVRTYDDFRAIGPADKTRLLSVVASAKRMTEGHRRRVAFVQQLCGHFGGRIDLFGAGFYQDGRGPVDLADKADGIIPYKYHVVIENSIWPHYFTEKLTDCLIGGAMPIYHGCSNIHEYFPEKAIIRIDINDPAAAIRIIEDAITRNAYEENAAALAEARRLAFDKYNLFATAAELCHNGPGEKRRLRLLPEHLV